MTHELHDERVTAQNEQAGPQARIVLLFCERRAADPMAPLAMAACSLPGEGTLCRLFQAHLPCLMQGRARNLALRAARKSHTRAAHNSAPASLQLSWQSAPLCSTRPGLCARASLFVSRGNIAASSLHVRLGEDPLTCTHRCPIPSAPTELGCQSAICPAIFMPRHMASLAGRLRS